MAEITKREFLMYLAGSYLVAAVLCSGAALISEATWQQAVGGSLIGGMILFAMTLSDQNKKRTPKE